MDWDAPFGVEPPPSPSSGGGRRSSARWFGMPRLMRNPEDPPTSREHMEFFCVGPLEAAFHCYAPSFRMRQYYREGTFEYDCSRRWANVRSCYRLLFESSDAVVDTRLRHSSTPASSSSTGASASILPPRRTPPPFWKAFQDDDEPVAAKK